VKDRLRDLNDRGSVRVVVKDRQHWPTTNQEHNTVSLHQTSTLLQTDCNSKGTKKVTLDSGSVVVSVRDRSEERGLTMSSRRVLDNR
jgi:hypothetical protein